MRRDGEDGAHGIAPPPALTPQRAEKPTIAAVDHAEAIAHEPHRGVADRRGLPGILGDARRTEQSLGDGAVGFAVSMGVDGAKHEGETMSALWREPVPETARRRGQPSQQASERLQALGRVRRTDRDQGR